jgi:predicted nucleic acid-binding protein
MATFFADTYAIVELLKGSPAYRQYKTAVLVTTEFNLCEFAYAVTRDFPDTAEEICSQVRHSMRLSHPGDHEYLRAAAIRRTYSQEKRKFSLIDCVGYSVAESLAIPFLTGDREFEDLPNVEYVK